MPRSSDAKSQTEHRDRLPQGNRLRREAILGGLHHEYWLEKVAA
jgi:putative transposase